MSDEGSVYTHKPRHSLPDRRRPTGVVVRVSVVPVGTGVG